MTIDLTGGLPDARELLFAGRPPTEGMRDAVNMWVADDRGEVGFPRFAVEALAPDWDNHEVMLSVGFGDGRIYRLWDKFPSMPSIDADGRATVLGAGPLMFRCVEPFEEWTAEFHGQAIESSTGAQIEGNLDGPLVDLEFEIRATMAVPPWTQGTLFPEAAEMLAHSVEGKLMGGPRYEQLFRAEGSVTVGGNKQSFRGTGLRIRRQGVRDVAEFWGHSWQSALFPSGKAFGYIAYPPPPDGHETYNEGYIFAGTGELIPAKVVEAPWLRKLGTKGQDVSVVLESEDLGITRIEGETVISTYLVGHLDYPKFPVLSQCTVRYRWDGEETYGMLERSSLRDRIRWT
jgi:hypothetical protein